MTATHSYLSPAGVEIAFVLIGLVVLGSALLVVTVQNLVHAALWLVVCLGAIVDAYRYVETGQKTGIVIINLTPAG